MWVGKEPKIHILYSEYDGDTALYIGDTGQDSEDLLLFLICSLLIYVILFPIFLSFALPNGSLLKKSHLRTACFN